MDLPAGAMCARHPTALASAVCDRCGNFACFECTVHRHERVVCQTCSRRFLGLGGSWLSVWAAIVAFAGLGCAPCAPVAIVLAVTDLSRIAQKKSPPEGRVLNITAILLGAVGILIWALVI